jgi:hypothetical protein
MYARPATVLLLLFAAVLFAAAASAETVTLTLDDVIVSGCGDTDEEAGCTLWFENTTNEDEYPGYCLFVSPAENFGKIGVYIWPARLVVDLSGLSGIESVEVDLYETHFAGSTRAFLYDGGGGLVASTQSYMEDEQTIVLDPTVPVARLAVSAHESYIWEIRLIGDTITPNEGTSFGAIKATYR